MNDLERNVENQGSVSRRNHAAGQAPPTDTVEVGEEGGSRSKSEMTTDAWTMAALAHASVLVTLLLAFAGGVGALVGLVVPLVIYLSYRERSRFITFHALQALVYQGAGVLAYLVLVIVLILIVTVAWIISGLLSAVIIGLLMMPLAALVTLIMVTVLLGAPLGWVAYGLYAAYQVYQGNSFQYWLIGQWVEREARV